MVFSLVLVFRSIIIHACVNVFGFNPFGICSASTVLRFMVFLIKFRKFSTITSLTVFHFCCFLLFFRDSHGKIVIVPQDLKALLIFLLLLNFFFSLLSRLANFYCSSFKFANSLLFPLHSVDKLVH